MAEGGEIGETGESYDLVFWGDSWTGRAMSVMD